MFDHHVLNSAPVLAAGSQHGVGRVNKLKNQARIHQDKEKLTHCSSRTNEHEPKVIHLKNYKHYAKALAHKFVSSDLAYFDTKKVHFKAKIALCTLINFLLWTQQLTETLIVYLFSS